MEQKRNQSGVYDVAKSISVLLVVIAHSTRMYTSYGAFSPANGSSLLAMVTEYIYQFHMPLFVFLSGSVYALCIQNGKYKDNAAFLLNKAKRLLIPYFVFGFLYVAPAMCLMGLTRNNYFLYCYRGIILSEDSRHLWYLEALFIIYVFSMLVRRQMLGSWKSRIVLLVLSALLFYVGRYVPSYLQLYAACNYQFYFVSGVMFHFSYKWIHIILNKIKWCLVILPVVLVGKFFINPNKITELFFQYVGITMIIAISMCIVEKKETLLKRSWYQCLKKNAMGIYLFHPMVIYAVFYFMGQWDISPYLLAIGAIVISLFVSIIATGIVRKLRLGIIIGE